MIKIQQFKYPKDIDEDCIPICIFFNTIGLKTTYSCCGHHKNFFRIVFSDEVTTENIVNFIKNYNLHCGEYKLIGQFAMWTRQVGDDIKYNWTYTIDKYEDDDPVKIAYSDLTKMINFYIKEN